MTKLKRPARSPPAHQRPACWRRRPRLRGLSRGASAGVELLRECGASSGQEAPPRQNPPRKVRFGEDAETNPRDACAPRNSADRGLPGSRTHAPTRSGRKDVRRRFAIPYLPSGGHNSRACPGPRTKRRSAAAFFPRSWPPCRWWCCWGCSGWRIGGRIGQRSRGWRARWRWRCSPSRCRRRWRSHPRAMARRSGFSRSGGSC